MRKYLSDILNPRLWAVMTGSMVSIFLIAFGIYYLLSKQGIITLKEAPGLSSMWVNWEVFTIFGLVFAVVVWQAYRLFEYVERKRIKQDEK